MKSKDDIIQKESTLSNQDLNNEVPTEPTIVADGPIETNEESNVVVEISASVSNKITLSEEDNTDEELSIDDIRLEIDRKISELETNEQYISLRNIISSNNKLLKESTKRIVEVKNTFRYANKYVKELSDKFQEVLSATGWFERYYDAVCLFDRANDSNESLEWSEAMKDSLEASITDIEKTDYKIKVLLNRRVANSVFTLSTKTPYLRLKEDSFKELMPFISIQSRLFYSWLKNIESLSLLLRNHWLELEFPNIKRETYYTSDSFNLEKVLDVPLSQYIETYIESNITNENAHSFYALIFDQIESFIENITEIESFHKNQYEENEKIIKNLTERLLCDYYKKELEPIYGIYDGIQLSKDSIAAKYSDSCERQSWFALLDSLSDTIISFLSNQNINLSPKLVIGKSHIDNSVFEINNKPIDFFGFAKIAAPTDAPSEDLKDYVASIRNYGFYHIDSDDNITIIRETVVSVYN